MNQSLQVKTSLMILILFLGGAAGCAGQSPSTQPPAPPSPQPTLAPTAEPPGSPAPALPSGWQTRSAGANQGQCSYAIDHPSDMDGASQGDYSWSLNVATTGPSGPVTNFIYISVIPDDFQSSEPGAIYNYDPAETQTLLNMPVGASGSLREDPNLAPSFTYTRLPDRTLSNQPAQTYQNTQPWEFPPGIKEIRYYLKANGCTYLIGGYLATVGSGQPGAIDEDLFDQIMATFRLAP